MSEAAATLGREGARPLGAQFAAVREERGLSIEKVASETHIRVERLREIERGDYSQFSHPSYARMYAICYAKHLGIPISRVRRPDAGVCGTKGYQYLQETPCDYVRTNLGSGRRRRFLPKLVTAALLVLFSLGGFKLSMILRDIERLSLDRMAREDKAALAVPEAPNAVPATSVTPESLSDPVGEKHEETEVPAAEIPVRRTMPSDAESALLVGANLSLDSARSK
jgi:transcriptional regulator with XRE-family HTH domain